MNPEAKYASDIAFTPSVKAIQAQKGSRQAYSRMEPQRAHGSLPFGHLLLE